MGERDVGIGFETGANIGGYEILSVTLRFVTAVGDSSTVKVSLWSSNSPRPNSERFVFNNPPQIVAGDNTFQAPADADTNVEVSETYFVMVERVSGDAPVKFTTTDSDSDRGAMGWDIANERLERPADESGPWNDASVRELAQPADRSSVVTRVLRIEPSVTGLRIGVEDEVRLEVKVFARQDLRDDFLAGLVSVDWTARMGVSGDGRSAGTFEESDLADRNGIADDIAVNYRTAPARGRYVVNASVSEGGCLGARNSESAAEADARCTAEFVVEVVSRRPVEEARVSPPQNPGGLIPLVIAGDDGTQ